VNIAIDAIAITGGLLIIGGVYLLQGLGGALVTAGVLSIAFALRAAKVYEDAE
jgi:hypothetical protein